MAFSSNGDGFIEHDRSGFSQVVERELSLDAFPSPEELWKKYKNEQAWKVSVSEIENNGFDIDIKNPHTPEIEHTYTSRKLLELLRDSFRKSDQLLEKLQRELGNERK